MTHFNKRRILNLMSVVVVFMGSSKVSQAAVIKVAADPWCPYTCETGTDKPGVFIEILRLALPPPEHLLEYQTTAWTRAVVDTREDSVQAIAGALKSDAPDFIFPTEPFAHQQSCFYVKKGNAWRWTDSKSLSGKTLGAVKEYTYGEPLDSHIAKQSQSQGIEFVTGTGTSLKLIKKLMAGRNDIIIEDKNVLAYTLSQNKDLQESEIINAGCLKPSPLFVAFGPKNPNSKAYAKKVSEGFLKLKNTPQYKAILRHYGLD